MTRFLRSRVFLSSQTFGHFEQLPKQTHPLRHVQKRREELKLQICPTCSSSSRGLRPSGSSFTPNHGRSFLPTLCPSYPATVPLFCLSSLDSSHQPSPSGNPFIRRPPQSFTGGSPFPRAFPLSRYPSRPTPRLLCIANPRVPTCAPWLVAFFIPSARGEPHADESFTGNRDSRSLIGSLYADSPRISTPSGLVSFTRGHST